METNGQDLGRAPPPEWDEFARRALSRLSFPDMAAAPGPCVAICFPDRGPDGFRTRLMALLSLDGLPAYADVSGHIKSPPADLARDALSAIRPARDDPLGFNARGLHFATALSGGPFKAIKVALPGEGRGPWRSLPDAALRYSEFVQGHAGAALRERILGAGFGPDFLDALELFALGNRRDIKGTSLLFAPGAEGVSARSYARAYPTLFAFAAGIPAANAMLRSGGSPAAALFPGSDRPEAVMARLRGCAVDHANLMERFDDMSFLGFLASMPLDWVPRTESEILAASTVEQDVAAASGPLRVPPARLMASCAGRWGEFRDRYRQAAGHGFGRAALSGRRWDMRALSRDADDRVTDLARRILAPLVARAYAMTGEGSGDPSDIARRAASIAHELFHARRSLPAILEGSARWHKLIPAVNAAMPHRDKAVLRWEPLSPPFVHGTIEVRPLVTATELRDEGADGPDADGVDGLAHCVSGYARDCFLGRCDILSVRRLGRGGAVRERLSTVEIEFVGDGAPYVRQHRGRRNADPSPEALGAVRAYLAGGLRRRALTEEAVRSSDPVEAGCGYDWTDDALLAAALGAYAPLLPSSLRGLGADDLAERLGLTSPGPAPGPAGP